MKSRLVCLHLVVLAHLFLCPVGSPAAEPKPAAITVAIAGVAHIHAPAMIKTLKARGDVRVKWLWDADAKQAQEYASQVGAKVARLEEIWSDPEVSAVMIFSETDRHRELALAAAAAGKHMFVEKPLGLNGKEAAEIAAAIERRRSALQHGLLQPRRARPSLPQGSDRQGQPGQDHARAGVELPRGRVGRLVSRPDALDDRSEARGTGCFGDLGTHSLDLLMWLLNDDVEAATADIKVVLGRYGKTDDCGEALLRFRHGTIATIAAAWVDVANPVSLEIAGTEGHAVIFNGQLFYQSKKVPGSDRRRVWKDLPPRAADPIDAFLDAVGGKKGQPLVTPAEAVSRVRVMEAIYKAAAERRWTTPK